MLNSKKNLILSIGQSFKFFLFLVGIMSCLFVYAGSGYAQSSKPKEKKAAQKSKPSSQPEINTLRQENLSLIKKVNELERTAAQQNKAQASLRNSLEKLQKDNDSYFKKLQAQEKERADLEAKLSQQKKLTAPDLKAKIEQLQKENASYLQKAQSLEKANAVLENDLLAYKKAKGSAPDLKSTVVKLQNENSALAQKISMSDKEKAIIEAMLDTQVKDLRQPATISPDEKNLDKTIHLNLGFAYALKARTADAIAEYRKALQYDPKDKDAHYNLGYLLAKDHKYKQAVEEYLKALKDSSQDKEVYYNLAIIYASKLKDQNTAQAYYQEFIEASSMADTGPAPK